MTIYPCAWVTNVLCVVVGAKIVAALSSKNRFLRRTAFVLPVVNTFLCVMAGFAGWWWFATTDVMYADAALPLIANPIALHLFHSRAWADLYPLLGGSRWIHFLILPSLIGTATGGALWWLVGCTFDRVVPLFRGGFGG